MSNPGPNTTSTSNKHQQNVGSDGIQIGASAAELVGLHGSAPSAQRSGAAQAAVAATGSSNSSPYGYTTAAQADAIVTLLNEIRAALVAKGIIKGS
jgi:hypothetical protein